MKNESIHRHAWLAWLVLWLPTLWLAALLAQYYQPGMNILELVANINGAIANPVHLSWTDQTPYFMLIFSIIYLFGIGMYYSTRLNRRPKEEHGCATQIKAQRLNWNLFDENDGLSIHANVQTIFNHDQ